MEAELDQMTEENAELEFRESQLQQELEHLKRLASDMHIPCEKCQPQVTNWLHK
jgi:hypothetical protein